MTAAWKVLSPLPNSTPTRPSPPQSLSASLEPGHHEVSVPTDVSTTPTATAASDAAARTVGHCWLKGPVAVAEHTPTEPLAHLPPVPQESGPITNPAFARHGDAQSDVVIANFKIERLSLSGAASKAVPAEQFRRDILTVARIDIRPGQFPNRVNPHKPDALLRVALLATDVFDCRALVHPLDRALGSAPSRLVRAREH